jgi:hypothetical protein
MSIAKNWGDVGGSCSRVSKMLGRLVSLWFSFAYATPSMVSIKEDLTKMGEGWRTSGKKKTCQMRHGYWRRAQCLRGLEWGLRWTPPSWRITSSRFLIFIRVFLLLFLLLEPEMWFQPFLYSRGLFSFTEKKIFKIILIFKTVNCLEIIL